MPLLTRKAVILAKVESSEGVDASPTQADDAILVASPNFEIDANILERNNIRNTLSPDAVVVGRKLATVTFTSELRGNGSQNSGNVADAPKIGTLLKACSFTETGITSGSTDQISDIVPHDDNDDSSPTVAWAKGGTPSLTKPVLYTLTVSTGGASGTAEISVESSNTEDADQSAVAVTSGSTAVALGAKGGTITPTWTGNLTLNDQYQVLVVPAGIKYSLTSDDSSQSTLTIYFYRDGTLYKLLGCRGTFTINAEAGNYGTIEFTFTGQYQAVTDAALPSSPVYEDTIPQQVESAGFVFGLADECQLTVGTWTYDQGNTITPRPSICQTDGYDGTRITARTPVATIDPEATLEATFGFWDILSEGKRRFLTLKQGDTAGNMVVMESPRVQIANIGQGDRDGILTYECDLRMTVLNGDDEATFYFC